jgi:nucleotide-binding universal stress UspA family protein
MTITRILVPTDFGAASGAALSYARDLARATGATLYLLHVVDDIAARFVDFPYSQLGDVQSSMEAAARHELDELARRRDPKTAEPHVAVLTSSAPAHAIVGYAADEHIDLIVMGTHGRAPVVRMFLGAVADRVVRTAPCPVLTVREPKPANPRPADRDYAPPPVAV